MQIDKHEKSFKSTLKLLLCGCMADAFEEYKWLEQ